MPRWRPSFCSHLIGGCIWAARAAIKDVDKLRWFPNVSLLKLRECIIRGSSGISSTLKSTALSGAFKRPPISYEDKHSLELGLKSRI